MDGQNEPPHSRRSAFSQNEIRNLAASNQMIQNQMALLSCQTIERFNFLLGEFATLEAFVV